MKNEDLIKELQKYSGDSEVVFFPKYVKRNMAITNCTIHNLKFPIMSRTNDKDVVFLQPKIKKKSVW